MTGTPPIVWRKLDPQELRLKLMGYGDSGANDDAKAKSASKGMFQ
jgi:hypothetical protein